MFTLHYLVELSYLGSDPMNHSCANIGGSHLCNDTHKALVTSIYYALQLQVGPRAIVMLISTFAMT